MFVDIYTHILPPAVASAIERFIYRRADLIVAPTQGIVTALAEVPAAGAKARRLWPVVDIDRFDPQPPTHFEYPTGPLRLLYAGTLEATKCTIAAT